MEETPHRKICVVGEVDVGKSSLIQRIVNDTYSEDHCEFKDHFITKQCQISNSVVDVDFYDYDEDFHMNSTNTFYYDADFIVVVFDVVDYNSFQTVNDWVKDAERNTTKNLGFCLVGAKIDTKKRVVTYDEGIEEAKKQDCMYFEVCSKFGIGIPELYQYLVRCLEQESEKN
ncbi:Rab family GTPase [Entamoeba marina]